MLLRLNMFLNPRTFNPRAILNMPTHNARLLEVNPAIPAHCGTRLLTVPTGLHVGFLHHCTITAGAFREGHLTICAPICYTVHTV